MKAIRVDELGPPKNLKVVEVETPEPGDDEVLIKVARAGIIYADCELRRGTYYLETKLPWFPGREVAGTIEAIGANVKGLKLGMRVVALVLGGGGYAEYVLTSTKSYTFPSGITVPAGEILELPEPVSYSQGLVYMINFRLAHILFHAYIDIQPEASVLIHGAAGGFGSVLTMIAAANGNEVIALSRTSEEVAFCRANGAQHCLNTTTTDYVEEVLRITNGAGVDYSINGVSGRTLNEDPRALKTFGEIIIYGYAGGKTKFDPWQVSKCVTLKTFSADDFLAGDAMKSATDAMYRSFNERPIADVTQTYALEDAPSAHQALEDGRAIGKIALQP